MIWTDYNYIVSLIEALKRVQVENPPTNSSTESQSSSDNTNNINNNNN